MGSRLRQCSNTNRDMSICRSHLSSAVLCHSLVLRSFFLWRLPLYAVVLVFICIIKVSLTRGVTAGPHLLSTASPIGRQLFE